MARSTVAARPLVLLVFFSLKVLELLGLRLDEVGLVKDVFFLLIPRIPLTISGTREKSQIWGHRL